MPIITLPAEQKTALVQKIQQYFESELEQDLGQFEAEFLIDFFAENFGVHYYNKGLYDAQAIVAKQVDSIVEAIDEAVEAIPQ